MTVGAPSKFVLPKPAPGGLTRRGLIKTGLGLTGLAGIMLPGTSLYAAMEAANGLSITDYRLTPPGWPAGPKKKIAFSAPPRIQYFYSHHQQQRWVRRRTTSTWW